MSEKSHTVAIGVFVIGAIVIALAALIFLLGANFGKKTSVVMVFDGSVRGLNVGAPLALRGVTVGAVTDIDLILDSDTAKIIMVVEAEFNEENIRRRGNPNVDLTEELISRGLRAQLNTQSLLTGLLYIELDFHPESALNLPEIDSPYLQIPTIPTSLERFTKKLSEIDVEKLSAEIESISNGIDTLVSGEEFQNLPTNANRTLESLRDLSDQLQEQLASSGPKLDTVLDETAVTVASANVELPKMAQLVEQNLEQLEAAITSFEHGMTSIDELASPDSAVVYQLGKALQEMTRAGRALQSLMDELQENPESIIRGKGGKK